MRGLEIFESFDDLNSSQTDTEWSIINNREVLKSYFLIMVAP